MEIVTKVTLDRAIKARFFDLSNIPRNSHKWRQLCRAILRTMREVEQGLHNMDIIHCDLKQPTVIRV